MTASESQAGTAGFVVLTYGRGPTSFEMVDGLRDAGVPMSAIVFVHNPDGSRATPSYPAGARVVEMASNVGYAAAMNAGLGQLLDAGHDPVGVATHDIGIDGSSVRLLLDAVRRDESVGAAGPRLMGSDGRLYSAGGYVMRSGLAAHVERGFGLTERVVTREWIDGSFMVFRAAALRGAGLFDPGFFLYFEDAEISARISRQGWQVGVCTAAVATTAPGGKKRREAYEYLMSRNGLHFVRRHGGSGRTMIASAVRLRHAMRTYATAARLLRGGDRASARNEARAAAAGLRGIAAWLAGRRGPPPRGLRLRGDIGGVADAKDRRSR